MLHTFLFIAYFLLLCFLLNRVPFISRAGLEKKWINILFVIKVMAGIAIGWISARYYPEGNDYWTLNQYGREEFEIFKSDPSRFFSSLFSSSYNHYDGFFTSVGSYWNDLKNNLVIKLLAVFNLASEGNYYINSLFFNFLSFFGHIALFRIFYSIYSNKKLFLVIGAFLLPSTLYFSSGIHKDCLVFTALALYSWAIFSWSNRGDIRKIFVAICCAALILFMRSHVFFVLVPASIAFLMAKSGSVKNSFLKTYAFFVTLLVLLSFFPALNPVSIMAKKQQDFFNLPIASSQLQTDTLIPTVAGLLKNTPGAIKNGFVEPLPWHYYNDPLFLLGIEMFFYLFFFAWWYFHHESLKKIKPVFWFCISIALPLFLFAGYIVPNAGSIVRYRAIYLPYLLLPLLSTVKSKHIKIKNI